MSKVEPSPQRQNAAFSALATVINGSSRSTANPLKRRRRRSRPRTVKATADTALFLAKKSLKEVEIKKYDDISYGPSSAEQNGTMVSFLENIGQGDEQDSRVGSVIKPVSFSAKWYINTVPQSTNPESTSRFLQGVVRIAVFWWDSPRAGSTPSWTDIMAANDYNAVWSYKFWPHRSEYKILWETTVVLNDYQPNQFVSCFIPLKNKLIQYNGDDSAVYQGKIWWGYICDNVAPGATNGGFMVQGNYRFCFTDA